ncbi:ATP-binding protein [Novosphingobium lindaniclasticum]
MVFLSLGVVQLVGSLLLYQAIDRQTLRADHARRIAELIVVSDRIHALHPDLAAPIMTTGHLKAEFAPAPAVSVTTDSDTLERIAGQVIEWEPSLAARQLHLATSDAHGGKRDLVGSIRLADGKWLNFRSRDITSMWPIALRASVLMLCTALACIAIGLVALRLLTNPLRRLTQAADAIGHGQRVEIRESGPEDLRDLAHSMNMMQERIARLLEDQARSFEAISHDLRTPLSRQQIATDLIEDREIADIMQSSINEMEGLLASLQGYLRAQHLSSEPEPVDLDQLAAAAIAPYEDRARLTPAGGATVETFPEPLSLAVGALVENAIRFGGRADLTVRHEDRGWIIEVEDAGPGIPPGHFEDVLTPFFRLDEARTRDTPGFGLGIPTAHRLMMRFGGQLSFATSPCGGLIARIRVPVA